MLNRQTPHQTPTLTSPTPKNLSNPQNPPNTPFTNSQLKRTFVYSHKHAATPPLPTLLPHSKTNLPHLKTNPTHLKINPTH
ncbi:MAG TPA: hypothetical protein VLL52_06615 [Anaerolineae bacterium]|nr:hypothetical protein [Anaerolineae bacterium]